ncbi:2-C-methyl-D-erythritol 4-phosphate cytidylyltransferase [Actimicrobium sp. GrIS 1.19]|uniref:2-C-methyl-D-erythritol 4-phosphate cytidylyltransferase n=1 Tax=Actimicrobium sp. GrIS 1.19 TaxID=3071708 RepID=UPI002E02EC6E|nr:2-C-methyl-D-erythritol 4-phosphate cytidylyltransferase [Actimicrobium sp. GrIS 1.19]
MSAVRCFALIPAAGVGARMGSDVPKQYMALGARPMLRHVLDTFAGAAMIAHVFLVVSNDDAFIAPLLDDAANLRERVTLLRCGGATRQASVLNGLDAVRDRVDAHDWMLVHDAARPGLTIDLIARLVAAVGDDDVGGLLALPVADTLKRGAGGRSVSTVDRVALWAAQTPQMFRHALLTKALRSATGATDEASAVEALGLQPLLVEGSMRNFKVTLPDDATLATSMLKGTP